MLTCTRRTVLMLAGCQALSMTGGSIVGPTGAIVGNILMSLVTATPIAMLDCGHEFAAAAFVIQWHSLGMFAPTRTAMGRDAPTADLASPAGQLPHPILTRP
jgi:hypothetical protein